MPDPTDIPNWRRLTGRITTSGQPTEAQLGSIRGLGATHVINLALHTHEKALPDEAGSVARLGMGYIHIPVEFTAPAEADFARFREALERVGEAAVHVHCIVNARVSAFFFRYRRDVLGLDAGQARREMETIWRPGGVWAAFIGDAENVAQPHRYAGTDY